MIQPKAGGREPTIHDAATVAVEHKGGGAALDAGVSGRVGAHLGADFSGVRVHQDPLAQEATAAMGARAFAYGSDVFLGAGESGADLGLMAHELTHVAQQGAAGQRAPQRQVQVGDANTPAEHQADRVAAEITGGSGQPAHLLVDDGPVTAGQMLKLQFLDQLRAQVTDAANEELGPVYSAIGCPYIEQYFGRYAGQPAAAGEAVIKRLAPAARGARTAADMIPLVVARVRDGVRTWRDTGQLSPEIAAIESTATSAAPQAQAQALRAPDGRETTASLEADLGPGDRLDGTTAIRMSSALGVDVSAARIHTGAIAARKADEVGALAFAVSHNVVMGRRAPAAGTLEADALLAHELAHVAQQSAAAADPVARMQPISGESAAAEAHADHAAAGALAQLHGQKSGVARLAERLGGAFQTGLQLQRCQPGSTDKVPKDAVPAKNATPTTDAAPAKDAAPPPGDAADTGAPTQPSWVGSETKKAGSPTVKGAEFPTFEAVAKAYFGHDYLAYLVAKANPGLNPKKIGPKTEIKVPSAIEVPTAARGLEEDPDDTSSIMHETWDVERDPSGAAGSLTPSVPSSSSGVTLGHGYDMKERSGAQIERELTAAGVDKALAKKYRGAAGKQGSAARAWIKKNKPFTPITADQEKTLFRQEYQHVTDETVRFLADPSRGYEKDGDAWKLEVNFNTLNPKILAFLVDLKFRGDLNPSSWKYIHDAVVANKLEDLQPLVADKKNHKTYFYDNYNRYVSRCQIVGATPVSEADWNK